ncbi:MAG: TIGR04282 family arsenosugar biosynthesis glycosyltransferase [bacterium]
MIILFVKAPVYGTVKTRLAKDLDDEKALRLYKAFILDVLQLVKETKEPFKIFFTPKAERPLLVDFLGKDYDYYHQEGKDLGERMANAFETIFNRGSERALLIGSDTVDITKEDILSSLAVLDKNDVVLGPASDGGFYLIGFRKRAFNTKYFCNIRWSSDATLRDFVKNLEDIEKIFYLPEKSDIDNLSDLRNFYIKNRERLANSKTIRVIDELKIF